MRSIISSSEERFTRTFTMASSGAGGSASATSPSKSPPSGSNSLTATAERKRTKANKLFGSPITHLNNLFGHIDPRYLDVYENLGCDKYKLKAHFKLKSTMTGVLAWYPGQDNSYVFALAHKSGRISVENISNPDMTESGSESAGSEVNRIINNEYGFKSQNRKIVQLCWNYTHTNLLAAIVDKFRNEPTVHVWDLNSKANPNSQISGTAKLSSDGAISALTAPSASNWGSSAFQGSIDASASMVWTNPETMNLAVGYASGRGIKIYDLRSSDKSKVIQSGKYNYTYCLTTCTENPNELVSTYEENVAFWDLRSFNSPYYIWSASCVENRVAIADDAWVLKLEWNLNDHRHLALISQSKSVGNSMCAAVKVIDIQQCQLDNVISTVHKDKYLECVSMINPRQDSKSFNCHGIPISDTANGLCWTSYNDILVSFPRLISSNNNVETVDLIGRFQMKDSCLIDFSGGNDTLAITENDMIEGGQVKICGIRGIDESAALLTERSKCSLSGPRANDEMMARDNDEVKAAWLWVKRIYKIREEHSSYLQPIFIGVKRAIQQGLKFGEQLEERQLTSDSFRIGPPPHPNLHERQLALSICGWTASSDTNLICDVINSIPPADLERKAALAIFHGYFSKGLEILASCKERVELCMSAVYLSDFGLERKNPSFITVNHQMLDLSVSDYLHWIFEFVADEDGSSFEKLKSDEFGSQIVLSDLIGFACRFFNDAALLEFMDMKFRSAVRNGRLDAIFISGLSDDGVELVQSYVDRTNECQIAAFLGAIAQYQHNSNMMILSRSNLVSNWIDCYRNSLDQRMLWIDRANFDSRLGASNVLMDEMIGIVCSFCGKTATQTTQSSTSSSAQSSAQQITKPAIMRRVIACGSCKRPLPRCTLCMLPMGSTHLFVGSNEKAKNSEWFSWCLSCRHGGHQLHVEKWFSEHEQCPVIGCGCKCALLDKHQIDNSNIHSNTNRHQSQQPR